MGRNVTELKLPIATLRNELTKYVLVKILDKNKGDRGACSYSLCLYMLRLDKASTYLTNEGIFTHEDLLSACRVVEWNDVRNPVPNCYEILDNEPPFALSIFTGYTARRMTPKIVTEWE